MSIDSCLIAACTTTEAVLTSMIAQYLATKMMLI